MSRRVIAIQCDPEYTDVETYFDFDGWDNFIIDGNNRLYSYHTDYDLYDRIQRYCIEYNELQNAIADSGHEYESVPYYKNATEAIEDYLGFTPTKMQVHKIKAALDEADKQYPNTDFDLLTTKLLSICEKRDWQTTTIKGYCQRDWQTVFYPADEYTNEFVNYIESVYFNTGDEFKIVDDPDVADVDITDETTPDDFDGFDCYYNYYRSDLTWNNDLLAEEIKKETGADEVILFTIDGYMTSPTYEPPEIVYSDPVKAA